MMTLGLAMGVMRESIMILLIIAGALVLPSFLLGLLISIFQATTQIQEQTLTFIPKLVSNLLICIFFGNVIVEKLAEHFLKILTLISSV